MLPRVIFQRQNSDKELRSEELSPLHETTGTIQPEGGSPVLRGGFCYASGMSSASAVLSEAMRLPRQERADVARQLIASLDDEASADGEDVEAAWLTEVEQRLDAINRGTATFEPWETLHDRIAARLRVMR
jgi:putative addiction module component (TIGR02574 family)